MDEYIDVADKAGKLTGEKALKSTIHQKGLYHHTAHLWLYTKEKKIVLAQRSAKKTICPLLWDVSVAGHIDTGETPKKAIVREAKEEIGLSINTADLQNVGIFKCFQTYENGIIDNEFHNTFIAELKTPINTLKLQTEEVEALKLVTVNEFKTLLANSESNMHFVASNHAYYITVLHHVLSNF